MSDPRSIAGVILAAGRSERYGANKLALKLPDGRTVLERSLRAVLELSPRLTPVFVVTTDVTALAALPGPEASGAGLDRIRVIRMDPSGGQGDSLAAGIRAVRDTTDCGAALIVLADQPFALDATWQALWDAFRSAPDVLASAAEAAGIVRPPVLVRREGFEGMAALRGDVGGRKVLEGFGAWVHRVRFPEGLWSRDVDTPEGYRDLLTALGERSPAEGPGDRT